MRFVAPIVVLLAACGGSPVALDESDDPTSGGTTEGTDGGGLECPKVTSSMCGNDASVIQGQIRLADGLDGPTSGTLWIGLAHQAYSGEVGGGYHTHTQISADLADGPVEFSLDMCAGGEMWAEENCDYGLVVILDQNNNQSYANLVPDPGEPATRVKNITMSCGDRKGPCLDIVLDCTDGDSCVSFSSPTCSCAEESCDSAYAICF